MKSASPELIALLATGKFVRADLWTITLNGGAVVRWTSHDQPISYLGNAFARGPVIDAGQVSEKVGVEVATLDLTIDAADDDLINGTPVIPFIARHGLDGAIIKRERAYAPDWSSPITGGVVRFAGKVTSIKSVQGSEAQITVSSWLVLLNASSPRNLFQAGCLRTLYDAGCGLVPSAYSAIGTVSTGGIGSFGSNLTGAAGYYSQGRIVFTTGANAGVSRTVRINGTDGTFTLILPLPAACQTGDTFTAFAGCDLAHSTCSTKFNNLLRFKGTPFVPAPTTALGATTTTTTSGGKG